MSARIGDQIIANGSSSDPTNKITTAILELDWLKINGKDVLVFCEAKDNKYEPTKNTSSEVKVTSTFCSLSTYIYICMRMYTYIHMYIVIASGYLLYIQHTQVSDK